MLPCSNRHKEGDYSSQYHKFAPQNWATIATTTTAIPNLWSNLEFTVHWIPIWQQGKAPVTNSQSIRIRAFVYCASFFLDLYSTKSSRQSQADFTLYRQCMNLSPKRASILLSSSNTRKSSTKSSQQDQAAAADCNLAKLSNEVI